MNWDASADLIDNIRDSISPVKTDQRLCQVLAQDYPRESSNLPISGGWGYAQSEAIVFVRDLSPTSAAINFVALEHHIAQKIIYEELIVFRPKDDRFSGINMQLKDQQLVTDAGRRYDLLNFSITCWSDWHWEQLKKEWEDFGRSPDFDQEAHAAKRQASQIQYERKFWFDITDVWDNSGSRRRA